MRDEYENDGLSDFSLDQIGMQAGAFGGARLLKFSDGQYVTREGEVIEPNRELMVLEPSSASTALNRKLLDLRPMVLKASTMPPALLLPEVLAAFVAEMLAVFWASIDSDTGASGEPLVLAGPAPVAVMLLPVTSAVAELCTRLVAMMPLSAMLLELLPSELEVAVTVESLVARMVASSIAVTDAVAAVMVALST